MTQNEDFEVWQSIKIDKKISSDFDFSFQQGLRFQENATQFKSFFLEPNVSYELTKKIKIDVNYRFSARDQFSPNDHRLAIGGVYRKRIKPLKTNIYFRSIYQYDFIHTFDNPNSVFRNRILVKYTRKKIDLEPYLGIEIWNEANEITFLRRYRVSTGVNYRISKKQDIKLAYLFQQSYSDESINNDYIITVGYGFKL